MRQRDDIEGDVVKASAKGPEVDFGTEEVDILGHWHLVHEGEVLDEATSGAGVDVGLSLALRPVMVNGGKRIPQISKRRIE